MSQLNKTIMLGNVATLPETIQIGEKKTPKTTFVLAVNRRMKRDDDVVEEVSYFDVEAYGPKAELIGKHWSKGDEFLFDGEARQDRWEGKDGNKASAICFVVSDLHFTNGRKSARKAVAPELAAAD